MLERHRMLPSGIVHETEFGLLIRNTRISQGRSARQVARSADISPAYLIALEQGENPKTKKPSIPSPDVRNRIFSALGITVEGNSGNFLPKPRIKKPHINQPKDPAKDLEKLAKFEREKAVNMVRAGLFDADGPNNEFNYCVELANSYGSAAVAMQVTISQLDKDIQELRTKYHIQEDQAMNVPEGE